MENVFPKLGNFESVAVGIDDNGKSIPLALDLDGKPSLESSLANKTNPYVGRFYIARKDHGSIHFSLGEQTKDGSQTLVPIEENEFPSKLQSIVTESIDSIVAIDLDGLLLSLDSFGNACLKTGEVNVATPYFGKFYMASGRPGKDQPSLFRGEIDKNGQRSVKSLKDKSELPEEVIPVLIEVIRQRTTLQETTAK